MSSEKVGYIYSPTLVEQLNKVDKISGRSEMVNSLINSYGLFSKLRVIAPQPCDRKQLQTFHSSSYLDYLADCVGPSGSGGSFVGDDDDEENLDASLYGLDHDCPIVEGLFDLCAQIGGASLTAADLLVSGECKYVINWFGGWHHAKRERASGYCYVNDCVLAILRLRKRFERVLYIDLDLHHGDGVQEAFEYTNKVVTLSLHKHSPGFFPGTGGLNETGKGPSGAYHTINVPFLSGLDDTTLTSLFSPIFTKLVEVYRPQAIVLQCGADGLYGDPIDSADQAFNLTLDGYMACVRHVIASQVPTMFLGGGGYNLANTARLWTCIVDLLVSGGNSLGLNNDIPDHDAFFLEYAPSYEMRIEPGCLRNKNTPDYVESVLGTVMTNLDNIKIE